jgi:hypothetical protein
MEKYVDIELEVIHFESEDVITASTCPDEGGKF